MANLLRWETGAREHRRLLQEFCCTDPPKKELRGRKYVIVHPRMWEYKVQCAIRSFEPPYRYPPIQLLLGFDDAGLGAVFLYEEVDGPGQVELCFMAIASRLRGKGGGYADEMVTTAYDSILTRAIEEGDQMVSLFGYVHPLNHACQTVCRRFGLLHRGDATPELQIWAVDIPVPEPD